jgi:nitrate reductase (NAD(P)H)
MREKGMLLAWAMNGEALEPDHGFPLRLVVPGQIGGRSVKWLKKIEVSDKESQHHLHFWVSSNSSSCVLLYRFGIDVLLSNDR